MNKSFSREALLSQSRHSIAADLPPVSESAPAPAQRAQRNGRTQSYTHNEEARSVLRRRRKGRDQSITFRASREVLDLLYELVSERDWSLTDGFEHLVRLGHKRWVSSDPDNGDQGGT